MNFNEKSPEILKINLAVKDYDDIKKLASYTELDFNFDYVHKMYWTKDYFNVH